MKDAEEVARMVWAFVGAAGTMVEGLDAEDEVKLLRLRTRKNELVIVPGMCTTIVGILVAAFESTDCSVTILNEICWGRF